MRVFASDILNINVYPAYHIAYGYENYNTELFETIIKTDNDVFLFGCLCSSEKYPTTATYGVCAVSLNPDITYSMMNQHNLNLTKVYRVPMTYSFDYNGITVYYRFIHSVSFALSSLSSGISCFLQYDLPIIYSDFQSNAVLEFLDGLTNWYNLQKGGELIADVTVDTSNIEQLIQTSNNINSSTDTAVKDIQNSLSSGVIGSGNGFTDEDRNIFKDVRLYIVLIFFCVGLTMFRTVIHQVGRNIRGK